MDNSTLDATEKKVNETGSCKRLENTKEKVRQRIQGENFTDM